MSSHPPKGSTIICILVMGMLSQISTGSTNLHYGGVWGGGGADLALFRKGGGCIY